MDILAQDILKTSLVAIQARIKQVEEAIDKNVDIDLKDAVNKLVMVTTNFSIDVTYAINNSRKEK